MMTVTPLVHDWGMGLLSLVGRPRPFEELVGADRDAVVLDAARDVWRANAALLSLIDSVDVSQSFRDDGHGSSRAWVQAVLNCSSGEAARVVAAMRVLRDLPGLAEENAGGEIGSSQLQVVAQVRKNPRCRERLGEFDALLTDLAQTLSFDDFQRVCLRLVAMLDPDGTHRDHVAAHERRGVSASVVGTDFRLEAHGGAVDGAEMIEILDRFTDAEFEADWAELVAVHGPNPPAALLRRSHAQRRFDALRRLFDVAAAVTEPVGVRESKVDFVIDPVTFEETLRRMVGLPVDEPDVASLMSRVCQTGSGVVVDPVEVVVAAIMGRVRRVVVDGAGVVVDAGRRRRFFTANVAEIVRTLQTRCTWPGCTRPARGSQLDHAIPWTGGCGPTSAANANILCGHHNRVKNRGFHTWRDPHGTWHTTRPDGTEITPRPPSRRAKPPP